MSVERWVKAEQYVFGEVQVAQMVNQISVETEKWVVDGKFPGAWRKWSFGLAKGQTAKGRA